MTYDSVRSTPIKEKQLELINKYYIGNASEGLKAFIKNKDNVDEKWLGLINNDPIFLDSIRIKTLSVKLLTDNINRNISNLKALYPNLKEGVTYFIIGFKQQGGLIRNNLSIIGTEVICSQLKDFEKEIPRISIHEYVHTQQTKPDFRHINVLTSCIREGACDFISELVLNTKLNLPYINYGQKNEVAVWKVFNQDMLTKFNDYWVSTGDNPILPEKDLGYYIGYAICKSYYDNTKDKKKAISDIIDLDYLKPDTMIDFLNRSKYEEYITRKGFKKDMRLSTEGYAVKKQKVVFSFSNSEDLAILDDYGNPVKYDSSKFGPIYSVAAVGDFNNWDIKDQKFLLKKNNKDQFSIEVTKNALGNTGDKIKFKFVINGTYWVVPKFNISNRVIEDNGTVNLYLKI